VGASAVEDAAARRDRALLSGFGLSLPRFRTGPCILLLFSGDKLTVIYSKHIL
jgi:hypothetical protein